MAPVTRRSSIELERSRKAKMLFLKKRKLASGVGTLAARNPEAGNELLVGAQVTPKDVKRRRKGKIPKVSNEGEQSSGLKRSGSTLDSEPVQTKHRKRKNVSCNSIREDVPSMKPKETVGDDSIRVRPPVDSCRLNSTVVAKITEVDKPSQIKCTSITSAALHESKEVRKKLGSLDEHPSCSSFNARAPRGVAPFVFVKIEEQSTVNDIHGIVKTEEHPRLDEANATTAGSSGDHSQVPKVDKEDTPVEINWKFLTAITFADVKSFVESLESGFRFKTQNSSAKGVMRYYNCRRIKVNAKEQCNRKVMVYIPNTENDECSVHIKGQHTCNNMGSESKAKMALQPNDYSTINEMLRTGTPKKEIKKLLMARNENISTNRLNYAVKKASAELYGSGTLSLGELEEWAKSCSAVPPNQETAFVIGYDIDHENGRFRMVYSSRKLLSLLMSFCTVAADCTFKTTLQGYPLMVICVIDNMRHAHPIAFATITRQEEVDYCYVFATIANKCKYFGIRLAVSTFISDGEIALKKAAMEVFGEDVNIVNCFFHVMQNVRKHLKKNTREFTKEQAEQLQKVIGRLQVSPSKQHFELACGLLKAKYFECPDFLTFFDKYMNDKFFMNWYEAYQPGCPATNNALEAVNRAIKECHLMKERVPFGVFKTRILTVLESYSTPSRVIKYTREYGLDIERKAFNWLNNGKKYRTVNDFDKGSTYVYLPGEEKKDVSVHDIDVFRNPRYANFDEFSKSIGNIHRVEVTEADWRAWNCTCYTFFKSNCCHHIVVVAVSRGCYKLRPEANTLSLTHKRLPGRPKKMTQALLID